MGWVQLGALMALAVQNSFQNLIVRYSREVPAADGMYIAGTVVLVTEFTKVFISLGMLLPQAGSPSRLGNLIVRELPPEKCCACSEVVDKDGGGIGIERMLCWPERHYYG